MLEVILQFVLAIVSAIAPGIDRAPGLASLPILPDVAIERSQAQDALAEAGRPTELPAGQVVLIDDTAIEAQVADEAAVEEAPPVDVSNAPESVDPSGVPAAEEANVPEAVGAGELPEQAGGGDGETGPPSDVPAGPPADLPAPAVDPPVSENVSETAVCAADARGPEAAACSSGNDGA